MIPSSAARRWHLPPVQLGSDLRQRRTLQLGKSWKSRFAEDSNPSVNRN
jgi:hypothetical protein